MRVIRTEIEIDAPPAEVWAVLTDFAAYPAWNPFILEAAGALVVGGTLTLRMKLGERAPQTFTPEVLAVRENAELRWRGTLRRQWLFSAEHLFELARSGEGARLVHSEQFRGVLVPLLRRMIDDTEREFRLLNAAVKDRVESG